MNTKEAKDLLKEEYEKYLESVDELYPDGLNALKVIPSILKLQHDKEALYGQSWRKYGNISAFLNTARKFDRIDNIMRRAMKEGEKALFDESSETATETFLDTVVDLASYSLLWVGYLASENPEKWRKFLLMNRIDMEEKNVKEKNE